MGFSYSTLKTQRVFWQFFCQTLCYWKRLSIKSKVVILQNLKKKFYLNIEVDIKVFEWVKFEWHNEYILFKCVVFYHKPATYLSDTGRPWWQRCLGQCNVIPVTEDWKSKADSPALKLWREEQIWNKITVGPHLNLYYMIQKHNSNNASSWQQANRSILKSKFLK